MNTDSFLALGILEHRGPFYDLMKQSQRGIATKMKIKTRGCSKMIKCCNPCSLCD